MRKKLTHMCLGGGGFAGLVYHGALRYLKQEGYHEEIVNVVGVSIGAFFATSFVLDLPFEEIAAETRRLYVEDADGEYKFDVNQMMADILMNKGFINSEVTVKIIDKYLGNMTFLDIAKKTGKNLIIVATHLTTMTAVNFSVDETPNVLVRDAIQASAALPLLFAPVKIGNDYYIDGGISCNTMPLIFKNVPKDSILLLRLGGNPTVIDESLIHTNLVYYLLTIAEVIFKNGSLSRHMESEYKNYIKLADSPVAVVPLRYVDNYIQLDISNEDLENSFTYGYEMMYKFFAVSAAPAVSAKAATVSTFVSTTDCS